MCCPLCLRRYPARSSFCAWDGAALDDVDEPAIGTLVAGRYRIERQLGRGGMGEVWLASDEQLGRMVALKRLRNASAAKPDEYARMAREARNAASLDHPNLVRIHDVIAGGDGPVLVLEYVPGWTLDEVIRMCGPLPVQVVARIVSDLADGLEAIHRAGLVHRDLKPSNVILSLHTTPAPRARILDFGITRRFDDPSQSVTSHGVVIGTAAYMSPEQRYGREVDGRADVFSLTAVSCHMLAGRLTTLEHGGTLSLANVPSHGWPEPLQQCLAQGLEPRRERRFASPAHFAVTLRATLDGLDGPLPVESVIAASSDASTAPIPTTRTVDHRDVGGGLG